MFLFASLPKFKKWKSLGLCLLAILFHSSFANAQTLLEGRVIAISDGDTYTLLDTTKTQHKIRLYCIDAPEKKQAFGQRSKQFLSEKIFGKKVTVLLHKKDKYGRNIGETFLNDTSINLLSVSEGMAWAYKAYCPVRAYEVAQQRAQKLKKGLWSSPNALPPSVYREEQKKQRKSKTPRKRTYKKQAH